MIPNSEERFTEAEYEYNRRQFLKMERGKKRAYFLFGLSLLLKISCIVICKKYNIFSFTSIFGRFCVEMTVSYSCSVYVFLGSIFLFVADINYDMEGSAWNGQVYTVCDTLFRWV